MERATATTAVAERRARPDETGLTVNLWPMGRKIILRFPSSKREAIVESLPSLMFDKGVWQIDYGEWDAVREMGQALFDIDIGEFPAEPAGYEEPPYVFEEWETPGDPNCKKCNGIGWVVKHAPRSRHMVDEALPCSCIGEREEREAIAAAIETEQKRLTRYKDFGHMTLDTWRGTAAIRESVRDFALDRNGLRFLVINGPKGTGKTHLAISAIKLAHEAGIIGRIAYIQRIFDELREATGAGRFDERFRFYADTPLLAIDDEGTEKETEFTSERSDYLINERYSLGLKTIITMNLSASDIPARIADRIFDAKYSQVIRLTGESVRQRAVR